MGTNWKFPNLGYHQNSLLIFMLRTESLISPGNSCWASTMAHSSFPKARLRTKQQWQQQNNTNDYVWHLGEPEVWSANVLLIASLSARDPAELEHIENIYKRKNVHVCVCVCLYECMHACLYVYTHYSFLCDNAFTADEFWDKQGLRASICSFLHSSDIRLISTTPTHIFYPNSNHWKLILFIFCPSGSLCLENNVTVYSCDDA